MKLFSWLLDHLYPSRVYSRGFNDGMFRERKRIHSLDIGTMMMERVGHRLKAELTRAMFGSNDTNSNFDGLRGLLGKDAPYKSLEVER